MNALVFFSSYIQWHYSAALRQSLRIWRNIFWFLYHFFSVPDLLKTLFSPWRRLTEESRRGFSIEERLEVIVVNVLMRGVGAVVRLSVIGFAAIFIIITAGITAVFYILWIILPIVVAALFIAGVSLQFV